MPVKIRTYTQRFFDRPGVHMQTPTIGRLEQPNAVYQLYNLKPDPHTGLLRRAPAWTAAAALPAGVTEICGAFYDAGNSRYCLIGEDASRNMVCIYTKDFKSWTGPNIIVTGKVLGGLAGRNVLFWGGYLWVIDNAGDVHRGTSYTTTLSSFYASSDAVALTAMNDRVFGATNTGTILRLTAVPDFGNYHNPEGDLNVIYLAPFRQYLTAITEGDDDTLNIFRLPDYAAHGFHQLARLPTPGYSGAAGCPAALFDDQIWLLTGEQAAGSDLEFDVYAFDGHHTKRAAVIVQGDIDDSSASGFLVWNNNLIFYVLDETGTGAHLFYILVGNSFEAYAFTGNIGANSGFTPFAAALGDVMLCTGLNGADEAVYYAQRDSLADGYLITPRMDFGHPCRLKKLHDIAAVANNRISGFKVVIKYRTDDDTNWTTAVTGNNTLVTASDDLKEEFTLLQVKIELDDDSNEGNQDFGLAAFSIRYSVNEG